MEQLPPPQIPPSGPMAEPGRSRLMIGGVAAVAAAVVAGGLIVGSQFVSADRPTISTTKAVAAQEDVPAEDEAPAEDDTPAEGDNPNGDDGSPDDDFDIGDLIPADVKAEFEAFEQCLDEQLGGVFGELGELDSEVWNGSVVVENLGGDGEDALSVYDFGAGDATVTVTKSGDSISVATSGDVATLDESFFESEHAEWEAAEEACADLLPEDVKVFDMEFGEIGDHLGDMLEEFPFEEMFDEGAFGDFEMMFDEGTLAEIEEMFESGEFGKLFESGEFGDIGKLFDELVEAPAGGDPAD